VIRICHLINHLEPGGAERALVNLIDGLNPQRFTNEVITLTEPGWFDGYLKSAGVPVTSLGMPRGRPTLSGLYALVRHLQKSQPSILQTWLYHSDLAGTIASQFVPGVRLVWNVRCSDIVLHPGQKRLRWIVSLLARLSRKPDAVIANSKSGMRFHAEIGFRPRRWEKILNGVDLARFHPSADARMETRARLGIAAETPLIGMIAHYRLMKDHTTFLRAAALFAARHPEARFVLSGCGCDWDNEALSRSIREAGLGERISLLGFREDIEAIYPALDLVTLSSKLGEGCPNVLIEAMACGVPCVATDVGDAREIIGDAGLVVPPRDPEALARAWEEVVSGNKEYWALRARARVAGSYSLDRVCRSYEALYEEMAGEPRIVLEQSQSSAQRVA
jgi:glycosyltransferase involved in cell wall biosynthesis